VSTYYSSLSSPLDATKQEIGSLLKSTHRRVLPYTSGSEDTWDALADLDAGKQSNTVKLIYTETEVIAFDSAADKSWNREHLWPKSHGVGYSGADFTDIHHLRPSDINVNSARGNKYFAACGVVSAAENCRSPANSEAAASTETDSQVWLPPTSVRGDIARALFYMEHRYSGYGNDPDLELTDCPTSYSDSKLAYLSQLIKWHIDDPVDDAEVARNQRACERWQGNRNIFVDFPELVSKLYGEPQSPVGSNGYQCNNEGTLPPTTLPPVSGNDACSKLQPGDIQVIGIHSDSPDEIALVALEDLPGGLELFLTDDGWSGSYFRKSEGTAKLVVPGGGISKGSVFGFGPGSSLDFANSWATSGSLALSTAGDSVIVYCQPSVSVGLKYNFLAAITFNGSWTESQVDSNNSGLPPSLKNAQTSLTHLDNYIYTGTTSGSKDDLITAIGDASNWNGSDSALLLEFEPFSVYSSITNCQDLSPGDVQVIGVHSDFPDEIALVALADIPAGLDLFVTDDAWTGSAFRGSEGRAMLSVPSTGIGRGTVFGFGPESSLSHSTSWVQSGSLALSTQGDSVIVYCKPNDSSYNFLAALTYDGAWEDSDFDSNKSDLPSSLDTIHTVLSHRDNYVYTGTTSGSKDDLIAAIRDNSNWNGSNSALSLEFGSFSVYSTISRRNESNVSDDEDSSFHKTVLLNGIILLSTTIFALTF